MIKSIAVVGCEAVKMKAPKTKQERQSSASSQAFLFIATAACFFLPLLVYAITGSYSRYATDDFAYGRDEHLFGVWGCVRHYYDGWQGRYSFLVVISALCRFLPGQVGFLAPIMLLLWCGGTYALCVQIMRRPAALCLAAVVPAVTLLLAPALGQSLYWRASSLTYIPPIFGLTWQAALLLRLSRRSPRRLDYALAAALPFVNAGFSETVAALQVPLALALLFLLRRERPVAASACLGALVGLAVLFAAPGNKVREALFPPHGPLLGVAAASLRDTGNFLAGSLSFHFPDVFDIAQWSGTLPAVVAVFALALLAAPKRNKPPLWVALASPLVSALLLFFCFLPARYGTSAVLPDRAQIIPCFLLVVSVVGFGFLLAPLVPKGWMSSRRIRACGVIAAAWLLWNVPLLQARQAWGDVAAMQAFAARWDASNAVYTEAGQQHRDVTLVSDDPFDGTGLSSDRSAWWVKAERQYYGLPN